MIILTYYEYYNINKYHTKDISTHKAYNEILQIHFKNNSNMTGITIEHENKRIHASISDFENDRLKEKFGDQYLGILKKAIIARFKFWEQTELNDRKDLIMV